MSVHILKGESGLIYKKSDRDIMIGILSSSDNKGYQFIIVDWDYANPIDDIVKIVKYIELYKLPQWYNFKSSKGKRISLCFKYIKRKYYFNMLLYLNCCVDFRYCTIMMNQEATARITKKWYKKSSQLQLMSIIPSSYNKYENKKLRDEFFKVINYEKR